METPFQKSRTSSASLLHINNVRYRCRVAYHGACFNRFQVQQAVARTVSGDLEAVLSCRFDRPVRVVGAGWTDAGVHARGQAMHFDLLEEEAFRVEPASELDKFGTKYELTVDARCARLEFDQGAFSIDRVCEWKGDCPCLECHAQVPFQTLSLSL
jgi:tRNA pseudouridine(38-40) synthase